MTTHGTTAYNAMIEASHALGLPRSFRTDLTTHDRAFCENLARGQRFLWAPYENGTHLISPGRASKWGPLQKIVNTLLDMGGHFYLWDGISLRPISAQAILEGALDEAEAIDEERPDLSGYDDRDTYEPSGAEYL